MKISWLGDGDYFKFANLDNKLFRNLRVGRVSECAVQIEGEHLVDPKGNVWRDFGSNYSISCGTEVIKTEKPKEQPNTDKSKKEKQEPVDTNNPVKRKRGRPRKNKLN